MANLSFGISGQSYYSLAREGKVFMAQAIVTAPVGYGTATATGGPLLWNGTGATTVESGLGPQQIISPAQAVNAVILGVSFGQTVAETTTEICMGLTGGGGQTAAPSSTTAIDGITCTRVTNTALPQCTTYRKGTVSTAGTWFHPLWNLTEIAITSLQNTDNWIDLAGMYVVPPNGWIAVAASATGTAAVLQVALVWAEIPVGIG